jgi:type I restriction enzyme S subunit
VSALTVRLGNVVTIDRDQRVWTGRLYVGLEDIEAGTGRLLGDRKVTKVKSTSFGFDARHVLYGRLRPYLNKAMLPDLVGHCSTEIFPLRPAPSLDRRYLWYWLTHSQTVDAINATCTGARMPRANMERVLDFEIPLPPLEEQRRIVAVLDEAFAAIGTATANAQKNLANARELSAMFPATGSQEGGRFTIGELLERGWLLGHMDGNHGGDYPRKDEFVDAGVTYLSANCIRDGLVDFSRAKFLSAERAGKLRKGFAKDRDVLFAHNATVGPVALLQTAENFVVLGTSLTYYRCDEAFIIPEYLASYLRSPDFVEQYSAIMRQSTRNQVPITKQREFFVEVPPIAAQRRLVASLKGFQEDGRTLGKLCQAKLAALTALKQSLLQRAFSGELTGRETVAA